MKFWKSRKKLKFQFITTDSDVEWGIDDTETMNRFLLSPTGSKFESLIKKTILDSTFKQDPTNPEVDGMRRAYADIYQNLQIYAGRV